MLYLKSTALTPAKVQRAVFSVCSFHFGSGGDIYEEMWMIRKNVNGLKASVEKFPGREYDVKAGVIA